MNIFLHYALIYDIIFFARAHFFTEKNRFGRHTTNSTEIMQTKTKLRSLCRGLCHRSLPINIHLNNNEIIIIFTEQKNLSPIASTSRDSKKLSSLFISFNKLSQPKHCCELWQFINFILIYIQAIIMTRVGCLFRGNFRRGRQLGVESKLRH